MHARSLRFALTALVALSSLAPALAAGAFVSPSDQVVASTDETRIRITQTMLPLTIASSNSYYFGSRLTWNGAGHAITIANTDPASLDNKVAIDLNGFELRRTVAEGTSNGIHCVGGEGNSIQIFGGTISGFLTGIMCSGYGLNTHDLGFTRNSIGLFTGGGATISNCTFTRCGLGLYVNSQQVGQTFQGGAIVTKCAAHLCTDAYYGGTEVTFRECEAYNIFGTAYWLAAVCTVSDCGGTGSRGVLITGPNNVVERSRFDGCLEYGIRVQSNHNRIVDNHLVGNGSGAGANARGISFAGGVTGNYLAGNTVAQHYSILALSNYDIPSGLTGNSLNILLTQLPQTIEWPCSVTLGGSLVGVAGQNGITISADGVDIDLAGHTLAGVAGSFDGIAVPSARRALSVRNGKVRRWGSSGIWASNVTAGSFEGLTLDQNGQYGLLPGTGARVDECVASANSLDGISTGLGCAVRGCTARANVAAGIALGSQSQAIDCQSSANRVGIGTGDGCQVSRCTLNDNTQQGVFAGNGCRIADCNVRNNLLDGIRVSFSCTVIGNNTNGNGTGTAAAAAILVQGSRNRIEGNNLSFEDGLNVTGTNNLIVRNTLGSANALIVAGNSYGPVVNVTGVNDISGTAGANHPWANFFY